MTTPLYNNLSYYSYANEHDKFGEDDKMIKSKLIKIGNSIGITIPKPIMEYLGLKLGDTISIPNIKKLKEGGN